MSDTTIPREEVLRVLKICGVQISVDGDNFTLAKEGVTIQTFVLPANIGRKMLFRFQYWYKVPIHWFFHPEMIPNPEGRETIQ
jgi:hypothetical protein